MLWKVKGKREQICLLSSFRVEGRLHNEMIYYFSLIFDGLNRAEHTTGTNPSRISSAFVLFAWEQVVRREKKAWESNLTFASCVVWFLGILAAGKKTVQQSSQTLCNNKSRETEARDWECPFFSALAKFITIESLFCAVFRVFFTLLFIEWPNGMGNTSVLYFFFSFKPFFYIFFSFSTILRLFSRHAPFRRTFLIYCVYILHTAAALCCFLVELNWLSLAFATPETESFSDTLSRFECTLFSSPPATVALNNRKNGNLISGRL